jgi:hypothetical protein
MGETNPTGYSAAVSIWLRHGERMIPLSHASSTFIIASAPTDLPPGNAEIVFTVDEAQYKRDVTLPQGMTRQSREAMVLSRDGITPF